MQVSLGWSHALGLDIAGAVWAWGSNRYGQCGHPPSEAPVVSAPTLTACRHLRQGVSCVSAGSEHSAAVTSDGEVLTWGWGEHGQLGLGSMTDSWQPTVVEVPPCTNVACGSGFTIAVQM